jgi:outer membrane protein OmpA-like peptidoglycan-associated protein
MQAVPDIKEGDVRVVADQGILRLSGDMLFPQGQSTITLNSPSDRAIRVLSAALRKVLPCFSLGPESKPRRSCNPNAVFIDAVFIEGHTDNVPINGLLEGFIADNLSLSARRAINTEQAIYLDEPGLKYLFSISPSQEDRSLGDGDSPLINASAFGDTRPVRLNDPADGRRRNRRIDVRLLMYSPRTENLDSVRRLLVP